MGQALHFLSRAASLQPYGAMALRITVADFRSLSRALAGTAFFFGLVAALFVVLFAISNDSGLLVAPSLGALLLSYFLLWYRDRKEKCQHLEGVSGFHLDPDTPEPSCRSVGVPLTTKPLEIPLISP
jgi:hypothetical protein